MDDEESKLKRGDIKPKDIVERLNTIRSGKSFKDSVVAKAMDDYIGSLSRPERVALLAFLKGIAQIVTGDVPGQAAEDPSDHPADVQMTKHGEAGHDQQRAVHVKPTVSASSKARPAEDDSPPAPIVPKRR